MQYPALALVLALALARIRTHANRPPSWERIMQVVVQPFPPFSHSKERSCTTSACGNSCSNYVRACACAWLHAACPAFAAYLRVYESYDSYESHVPCPNRNNPNTGCLAIHQMPHVGQTVQHPSDSTVAATHQYSELWYIPEHEQRLHRAC